MNLRDVFKRASALGVKLKRNKHDDFTIIMPGVSAHRLSLKNVCSILDSIESDQSKASNDNS